MSKKKMGLSKKNKCIVVLLSAVAVCIVAYLIGSAIFENRRSEKLDSLRDVAYLSGEESETSAETVTERAEEAETIDETQEETEQEKVYVESTIDFDQIKMVNPDIYAWITVPGTNVDHPVLTNEEDNYYLMRNLDLSEGYPGCLYTNKVNSTNFSDYITVIYGHNLTRNRMFGSLHNYEDETFFEENREFTVYTEENEFRYEVIAAVYYNDVSIPYYYDVNSFQGMNELWQSLQDKCDFETEPSYLLEGIELTEEDRLLVLSTCIRQNGATVEGRRYLVIGRLQEILFYSEEESLES